VRLCVEDLYSRQIAAHLRDRGHDVISVHDRRALVGLPDAELVLLIAPEDRAVLTETPATSSRSSSGSHSRGRRPLRRQAA
jgi:Domain of unknown function (DUF5615)